MPNKLQKPRRGLQAVRRILASAFFLGVTLLFLDFTGTLHHWLGWMAKVQFLPAVMALNLVVVAALIFLTLIFGRIYCSVICPMGVMQDGIAWLGKKQKKNRYSYSKEKKWLRYPMLVVFIAVAALGFLGIADLIAPYSSFGRIAQNIFQPIYIGINNLLATAAEHLDSYAFYHRDVWIRSLPVFIIAAVTFVFVAILAWRGGRTYCNTICPVGTVLSFFARFSWFRIYFDGEKCRQCSMCSRNCKGACNDYTHLRVDSSRCVTCGDCLTKCRFGALHYGHPSKDIAEHKKVKLADIEANAKARAERMAAKAEAAQTVKAENKQAAQSTAEATPSTQASTQNPDESRRHFLLGMALATSAATMGQAKKKLDGGLATLEEKQLPERTTPVTPPGSQSVHNLAHHCTACQLCVAECPNDILRPSTDPEHFMQPVMDFERGFCRPECTRCSEVCPTGAIKKITTAEKVSTHIGHAVYNRFNCVALTDGVMCGNCSRHCPTGAIEMIEFKKPNGDIAMIPSVNESVCIGCGACEYVCPARPISAIYVEGHEVHRLD